jgi:hypothetical protein
MPDLYEEPLRISSAGDPLDWPQSDEEQQIWAELPEFRKRQPFVLGVSLENWSLS